MSEANVKISIELADQIAQKALSDFVSKFALADQATKKFKSQAKGSFKQIGISIGKALDKFDIFTGALAANVATKAISFLGSQFSKSAEDAIEFNQALTRIASILPENEKNTDRLGIRLGHLAQQFGTTNSKQAKAYFDIISSGISNATDAMKTLVAANNLAIAGNSELDESVKVLAEIINVYGQENISAAEASDALALAAKIGKTNIQDLSNSLGTVLPLARQLGVSFDEVAAATAVLTSRGQTTSERVNQLNSIFQALLRNGDRASELFGKKVGDAFSLTALKTKGLQQFLIDLNQATGGSEVVLQKLLRNTQAVTAVLDLSRDNFTGLNKAIDDFSKKTGTAEKMAGELQNTLAFQWDKFTNGVTRLGTALMQDLEPALRMVTKGLNAFLDAAIGPSSLDSTNKEIQKITEEIERLKSAIANSGKETGLLAAIFGGVDVDYANRRIGELTKKLEDLQATRKEMSNDPASVANVKDINAELEATKNLLEERKKLLEARRQESQLIQEKAAAEIEILKAQHDARLISDEEFYRRQRELEQQAFLARNQDLELQLEQQKITYENYLIARDNLASQYAAREIKLQNEINKKKQDSIWAYQKWEEQTDKERVSNMRSTFGYIATLQESSSKELFAIGKAAAISQAFIDAQAAVVKALAAAPPPYNFALAAAVGAAAAVNIAKIASAQFGSGGQVSTPAPTAPTVQEQQLTRLDLDIAEREKRQLDGDTSEDLEREIEALRLERERLKKEIEIERLRKEVGAFATGGIVPGTSYSGDKLIARVNSGEMILNRSQQANLYRMANEGVSVDSSLVDKVEQLARAVYSLANQPISIQVDGREIINVTRAQLSSGRTLA